jgi:hypothetical protein
MPAAWHRYRKGSMRAVEAAPLFISFPQIPISLLWSLNYHFAVPHKRT